jgi:hypothetical protein
MLSSSQFFGILVSLILTTQTSLANPIEEPKIEEPKPDCIVRKKFCSSIATLSDQQKRAMLGVVWHKSCPVALRQLRVVNATHRTFNGSVAMGYLVVHQRYAKSVQQVLAQLFEVEFPIESMIPMEAFGGDDERSVLANNSSAFNCRAVKGARALSEHAYGRAIDINPQQNPMVKANKPVTSTLDLSYLDRVASANRAGVIAPNSVPVKAFKQIGWGWGGHWRGVEDYQHFSVRNR